MIKIGHMVHAPSADGSQRTRSISIDVTHEAGIYNNPNVSNSSWSQGFSNTIFFKTVDQLQDYVNECRLVLGEWIVESMGINDDQ